MTLSLNASSPRFGNWSWQCNRSSENVERLTCLQYAALACHFKMPTGRGLQAGAMSCWPCARTMRTTRPCLRLVHTCGCTKAPLPSKRHWPTAVAALQTLFSTSAGLVVFFETDGPAVLRKSAQPHTSSERRIGPTPWESFLSLRPWGKMENCVKPDKRTLPRLPDAGVPARNRTKPPCCVGSAWNASEGDGA